jgi:hypothetical protein
VTLVDDAASCVSLFDDGSSTVMMAGYALAQSWLVAWRPDCTPPNRATVHAPTESDKERQQAPAPAGSGDGR